MWNIVNPITFPKDPCKKCIVRPCCKNKCEKRENYELDIYPCRSGLDFYTMRYLTFCSVTVFFLGLGRILFRKFM